ncbi:ENTH-domain-containing protein, partial [Dimargaris cristalligena]
TMDSISMWDVKDMFNKVKNVVMNYTEMEIKVNEATNGDAWGASSTLMKEIAQATYSFQNFNEIMPCIYKRFSECEAHQWRQIYKALTLLEYLLKNGSDRVVDDVKAHITTIKMLRSFHHIDDQGKDQGIN